MRTVSTDWPIYSPAFREYVVDCYYIVQKIFSMQWEISEAMIYVIRKEDKDSRMS